MSKEARQKKKKKQPRLPSEYTEGTFHFKTGSGWRACYDSDREFYSAETFWAGYYDLYEITEVVFSKLKTKGMERRDAYELIVTGRHLYKSVSDRNGSYDIALDEDYASLCPWADVQKTGETWDTELTDLAVAVFDSEKQNREQRLKRKNGKAIMNIELIPLLHEDKDITDLMRIHASPSVAKHIHISENYFDYVTSTDKGIYYKIMWNRGLAGGVYCEYADGTMFLSICIDEIYRRHGIAEAALNQLFLAQSNDVNVIEVSIDETNVPSLSLFQKLGFSQIGREEELIILRKLLC